MNPSSRLEADLPVPPLPSLSLNSTASAAPSSTTPTPTAGAQRRIAIAVDLSEESAYAVEWAVENYLRPGDAVILLYVRPTSVLYGADWGSLHLQQEQQTAQNDQTAPLSETLTRLEDDFDNFTNTKAHALAKPLIEADVPYKIHIVKDHDLKDRLCLEVERLGLRAMIMGSRGFGGVGAGAKRGGGRLGSVSDYCVNHCVCPVVVVRDNSKNSGGEVRTGAKEEKGDDPVLQLHPVPEVEQELEEYSDDDSDEQKDA